MWYNNGMRQAKGLTLGLILCLYSLSLDHRQEGFRGLAGAWNIIPSRSLSGLHYIFKGFEYNHEQGTVRVSGPVIELTQAEKLAPKIFPEGYSLEMDQEDFEEEQEIAQSVFQARSATGRSVGTAFLVGQNVVLTNRHLMAIRPGQKKWSCGFFSLLLNHKEERVDCQKVRYCSSRYDFCVIQMSKMQNGKDLGSEVRPLRLARRIRAGEDVLLIHIGNAAGLGLQASRGKGLRVFGGEFHHFVPTLIGSSGAPLFDEKGQVIGINWGHTGKEFDDDSYNRGVLSSTIFHELRRTHPYTLRDIKSFRSWSSREKKHRLVKVESPTYSRLK